MIVAISMNPTTILIHLKRLRKWAEENKIRSIKKTLLKLLSSVKVEDQARWTHSHTQVENLKSYPTSNIQEF
jgi:hypothetical protein